MGISTFYGCVRLITNLEASQPFGLFQSLPEGGSRTAHEHSLHYLLRTRFNTHMSSYVARRALVANMLVYGEAIAHVVRDENRQPIAIVPYPACKVQILEDAQTGLLVFQVPEQGLTLLEDDVIYLKDLDFNGRRGGSVIGWQRQNIKVNLLSKGFLEKYYEKGTFMAGILEAPNINNPEQAKQAKDNLIAALRGDTSGGYGLAVLGMGAKYQAVSRTPVESQMVEFLSRSERDIAKAFNVPLVMIGDSSDATAWGTGIESLFIGLTNTVIIPIAVQLEQEIDYKCLRADEFKAGFYTKHNFRNLLRGDSKSYAEYVTKLLHAGVYNIDEVRAWEELPPLSDGLGKHHWMQTAMQPISKILQQSQEETPATPPLSEN